MKRKKYFIHPWEMTTQIITTEKASIVINPEKSQKATNVRNTTNMPLNGTLKDLILILFQIPVHKLKDAHNIVSNNSSIHFFILMNVLITLRAVIFLNCECLIFLVNV